MGMRLRDGINKHARVTEELKLKLYITCSLLCHIGPIGLDFNVHTEQ